MSTTELQRLRALVPRLADQVATVATLAERRGGPIAGHVRAIVGALLSRDASRVCAAISSADAWRMRRQLARMERWAARHGVTVR